MIILGLTGSIGMGKSTTAAMFRDEGVPVFDSDACVHDLYRGAAVLAVEAAFPGTTDGSTVDRAKLGARVIGDAEGMRRLEGIIHPLVREARDAFVAKNRAAGVPVVVLDIPLLFETGGDRDVDAVAIASASESVQKARVLARPGMTPDKFSTILLRQVPDAEKRSRARFVIETGEGLGSARRQVRQVLEELRTDGTATET